MAKVRRYAGLLSANENNTEGQCPNYRLVILISIGQYSSNVIFKNMPKVTPHWTFHRHFFPLTCRSKFSPERAITPPPLTQHRIFLREEAEVTAECQSEPVRIGSAAPQSKMLILKPRGDVSRISRGGYNLQDKLGWPPNEYEEVRVSMIHVYQIWSLSTQQAFIVHLAREHLAVRKPWSRQLKEQLQIVFVKVGSHPLVLPVSNILSRQRRGIHSFWSMTTIGLSRTF